MARIRTIKPEYWTDSDILKLSITARLFYIGLWNFADDNGVIEYDPISIKAKIFPADKINVEKLITELQLNGKVLFYEVEKRQYLLVKNLKNHQVIDRPRKSALPLPNENQLKSIEIIESSVGIGKDRKGKDRIGERGESLTATPTQDEAKAFFQTNGSSTLEAETFYDHFKSNGWKIGGKAPMKDWQAAARNWIRRSKPGAKTTTSRPACDKPFKSEPVRERTAEEIKAATENIAKIKNMLGGISLKKTVL